MGLSVMGFVLRDGARLSSIDRMDLQPDARSLFIVGLAHAASTHSGQVKGLG
jgi:hypothetical protein